MSRNLVYIYGGRRHSSRRSETELVPLSEVVPHVYTYVSGISHSSFVNALSDALLNEVAQAVADLVTIYGAPNEQVPIKPLPIAEVKHGTFQRAATVLRISNGSEYRRLYIRRGDVRAAAAVLKKSGARFTIAEGTAAALERADVRQRAASELSAFSRSIG